MEAQRQPQILKTPYTHILQQSLYMYIELYIGGSLAPDVQVLVLRIEREKDILQSRIGCWRFPWYGYTDAINLYSGAYDNSRL